MTSSRFYSKGRKWDLRRETLWPVAYGLLLFFAMPVALLFELQGLTMPTMENYATEEAFFAAYETMRCSTTLSTLGMGFVTAFLAFFGIIEAYHAFGYLHRAREIDFVHALPQDRKQIFRSRIVNSLLCVLIPYAVCLLAGTACALVSGVPLGKVLPGILTGAVFNVILFLLSYAVSALAVMMTGRAMTWLFGTCVFFGYFPSAAALIDAIPGEWFRTYAGGGPAGVLSKFLLEPSPLTQGVYLAQGFEGHYFAFSPGQEIAPIPFLRAAVCFAAAVLLLLLAERLYKIRALECAGEAMAFRGTERPIRIFLTALAALAGMAFLREMERSLAWILFAAVAAAVLAHLVIELIYRTDIRKIFSHKRELAIVSAAAAGVVLLLWFDAFGYETWIPKAEKVENAAVSIPGSDVCDIFAQNPYGYEVDCGSIRTDEKSPLYQDPSVLSTPERIALAAKIAEMGGAEAAQARNEVRTAVQLISDTGRPMMVTRAVSEREMLSVNVTWNLKNGRKASRGYAIPKDLLKETYAKLYDDEAYRAYLFPAMTMDRNFIRAAVYEENGTKTAIAPDLLNTLLEEYFADLGAQTFEERGENYPVGILELYLTEEAFDGAGSNVVIYEKLKDYYFRYPVYADFAKTAAVLKKAGADPGNAHRFTEGTVLRAESSVYDEATDTLYNEGMSVEDPQDKAFLNENLQTMDYTYYNLYGKGFIQNISFYYEDDHLRQRDLGLPDTPECRAFAEHLRGQMEIGNTRGKG